MCAICCVDMEKVPNIAHIYIKNYSCESSKSKRYLMKKKVVNHAEYCNRDISASETIELVLESHLQKI